MGGDQRAGSPLRPECSRGTWPVGHGGQLRRMRIRNSGISAISTCAGDRRADVSDRKIRARPRARDHTHPAGGASRAPHLRLFIRGLWSAQPQGLRVRLGLGLGIVAPEGRVAARDRSGTVNRKARRNRKPVGRQGRRAAIDCPFRDHSDSAASYAYHQTFVCGCTRMQHKPESRSTSPAGACPGTETYSSRVRSTSTRRVVP